MASETAPSEQADHRSGEVIAGRYVLQRKLGEGGMGVVWVARSTALDVDVALKMLRRELAGTQAVERMAREARTAAQLGHPAMVRVLDFGTSELGQPFLAMELLQGEELHLLLAREQRLSAERAAALLLPIIDGLAIAHEKGIVHRDIKPENIFIARDDQGRIQPKLLDFGIAKLENGKAALKLTQVGAVMGSPYYLSPEQAEGLSDIDFRCDIWSIGVVLYELVTGVPPFAANNYNALIRSILRDSPKPTTEHAAGDAHLWTIIARCLKKETAERWSSMWELGEALALWLYERGVRVDAASRSLKSGWLESGVTGLQILVASEPPDAVTLVPPRMPAAVDFAVESPPMVAPVAEASAASPVPDALTLDSIPPARSASGLRGKGGLLAVVGVVVAAAGILFAVLREGPAQKPDSALEAPRPSLTAQAPKPPVVTAESAVPGLPPAVAVSALPSATADAPSTSKPALRAPARAVSPRTPTPKAKPVAPRKPPAQPGVDPRFGF